MILSDWKRDKSKPKVDTMVAIATYLNADISEFVDKEIPGK